MNWERLKQKGPPGGTVGGGPNALVGAWARRGMKERRRRGRDEGGFERVGNGRARGWGPWHVGGAWLDEDWGMAVSESTGEEPVQPFVGQREWPSEGGPRKRRETRNGVCGDMDKGAA